MRGPRTSPARVAALSLALAAGGCVGPLERRERDLGLRYHPDRFRQIEPTPLAQYERRDAPDDATAAMRSRFDGRSEVGLSLEEVRAGALEHNLQLRVALLDPTIAATSVSEEEARFEAAFTTRALWQQTDSPTSSSLDSNQAEFASVEPGVRIPLRTGGSASVSLPLARSETDNQFSTLNPAYTSDLRFSISHPLLRGAGRRVNTAALRIASYNRQISESQTRLQVIGVLAAADRAYWRLYRARRALEVAQQQYELASELRARAQRRVDAGDQPEIELIRAQSGLAQRLEAVIVAQNEVLTAQRALKRLVSLPGLEIETPTMVLPTTPPDPVAYEVRADELVELAMDARMELLELELRLLADAANIRLARDGTLPRLDLDAGYTINGLGDSLHDSLRTTQRNRFEDWSVGLTLEVPIGNEAAEAQFRRAVLGRLQRLATREDRRQTVRQEVLDAIDRVDAGWQRILAARQSAILSARTLQAEQRQFDVGQRTATDVLDAAAALAQAQLDEIAALTDYQTSQIDLAVATGTLLGAGKVRWEPATPDLRDPARDAIDADNRSIGSLGGGASASGG